MLTCITENSAYDIFLNENGTFHVRKIAENKPNDYGIDVGWEYTAQSIYLCVGDSAKFDSIITSRVRSIQEMPPERI